MARVPVAWFLSGCLALIAMAGISATATAGQYDLTVDEATITTDEGDKAGIGFNGASPGPTLHFKEGEEVVIDVTNNLDESTSIHWHGFIVPFEMDGVPTISYDGIAPGETFTYRFPIRQTGTYWYHSHSGFQEPDGAYGAIIIEPDGREPFRYDRDYVVILKDAHPHSGDRIMRNLKMMPDYYNRQQRTAGDFFRDVSEMGFAATVTDRMDWGEMRMMPTDIEDVHGFTGLINGKTPAQNWTGLFEPGERVRLRFINASAMTYFDVRIPGLDMVVVQADGNNVQPVKVDEFRIAVAETYDVIVRPKEDRAYTIFAESMGRSGFARATLASRAGAEAVVPDKRQPPLLTMADMPHGAMAGMDHGSMAGMDHGAMSQDQDAGTGMDNGSMAGMDHGAMAQDQDAGTGMDHGSMVGVDHGAMSQDQGAETGMDHGSMAGMDHGAMSQDQDAETGMDNGSMAGMDHGAMAQDQDAGTGMDHGSMAGMDHGAMAQDQDAGTGMDQGSMSGMGQDGMSMEKDAMAETDHSAMTGMDHSGHDMAAMGMPADAFYAPGSGLVPSAANGGRFLSYADLKAQKPLYEHREATREIELRLTGNMERYVWSIDGVKYGEAEPIRLKYGERVRFTFINETMMAHPMHLHGMWSILDNGNGKWNPAKHVVSIAPATTVSFETEVDAPGEWAFHCHLSFHAAAGMFRKVVVEGGPQTAHVGPQTSVQ